MFSSWNIVNCLGFFSVNWIIMDEEFLAALRQWVVKKNLLSFSHSFLDNILKLVNLDRCNETVSARQNNHVRIKLICTVRKRYFKALWIETIWKMMYQISPLTVWATDLLQFFSLRNLSINNLWKQVRQDLCVPQKSGLQRPSWKPFFF